MTDNSKKSIDDTWAEIERDRASPNYGEAFKTVMTWILLLAIGVFIVAALLSSGDSEKGSCEYDIGPNGQSIPVNCVEDEP